MFCSRCGTQLGGERFCTNCGQEVGVAPPNLPDAGPQQPSARAPEPQAQGFLQRTREKQQARILEIARNSLAPGEQLLVPLPAAGGRNLRRFILSAYLFPGRGVRNYIVCLTDQRLIVVRGGYASIKPRGLAFADPRSSVSVLGFRNGLAWSRLSLKRAGGRTVRLYFARAFRAEASRIRDLLRVG